MTDVTPYFDDQTKTATYLVRDASGKAAILIDPVLDYDADRARFSTQRIDAVLDELARSAIQLVWVLDTHAHADHVSAAHHIRSRTGARIGIGADITKIQAVFKTLFNARDVDTNGSDFDALFQDGDRLTFGTSEIDILHTPGHTPACMTYVIGDAAFVGDTLFMPDTGSARADFPGGDARTLYRSIRHILSLPPETRIFVGHDYLPADRDLPAWESTVAEQKACNIHAHDDVNEETFVTMREARDATLAPPRLILPSLQLNIRAGALPPPEEDGRSYLKLPINQI
jgi:glyoxylase-like metal-dependent hydrolase (beta-lactamase superfamily II)